MAYTQEFIFGVDACAGRLARHVSFADPVAKAEGAGHDGWVVVLEFGGDKWNELDARDMAHARRLALQWTSARYSFSAKSASVQQVHADGSIRCLEVHGQQPYADAVA